MSSAERNSISSCFQHDLQDGYLSLKPHVKGGLFPLMPMFQAIYARNQICIILRESRACTENGRFNMGMGILWTSII